MKLIPLLLFVIVATGCTSTHTVSRSDPAAISDLSNRLHGQTAEVVLLNGERERGRVEYVRADSVAWQREETRRAVETYQVDALVRDNRLRSTLTGLAIGTGIGLAISGIAWASDPEDPSDALGQVLFGYLAIPVGVIYGTGIGAAFGRRRVYRFGE